MRNWGGTTHPYKHNLKSFPTLVFPMCTPALLSLSPPLPPPYPREMMNSVKSMNSGLASRLSPRPPPYPREMMISVKSMNSGLASRLSRSSPLPL